MAIEQQLLTLLSRILASSADRPALVREFQQIVWSTPSDETEHSSWRVFGDGAIPRYEAPEIVWNIQTTQVSLRGSAVERALRTIQRSDPRHDDADFLKTTLEAIEEDFWTTRPSESK